MNIAEIIYRIRNFGTSITPYTYKGKLFSVVVIENSRSLSDVHDLYNSVHSSLVITPLAISLRHLKDLAIFKDLDQTDFDITKFYILRSRRDVKGVYA